MRSNMKMIVIGILAVIFTIVPFYTLIIKGPFHWQSQQPQFREGGIELIIFGILMLLFWLLLKKKSSMPIIVFSLIYLSMNGVIVPFITDIVYFEIIIFIGCVFCSIKRKVLSNDIILSFLMGISIWGAGAVVLSGIGQGGINDLRIYTIALFLLTLILKKGKKYQCVTGKFEYYVRNKVNAVSYYISLVVIVLIVLALFAKTNTAQDYDSLWYGLRPQYVLLGDHSFYDNLGFASFVYYYPKLMELFYIPISGFSDYSFLQGANVFVFALLLYAIKYYMDCFCKGREEAKMLGICVFASIPAIANISATAKPDILGAFFVFVAFLYFSLYTRRKRFSYVVWGCVSLLLCTGTKVTYILWGGMLGIIFLVSYLLNKRRIKMKYIPMYIKKYALLLCASIILIFGVHFRTFLLTGYPLYPVGLDIWNKLGFTPKDFLLTGSPLNLSSAISLQSIFQRVYGFLLNPSDLAHVVMLWTSNIVFLSLILYLFYINKGKKTLFDILTITGYFLVMLYFMLTMNMPDGNYFIIPILVIVLLVAKNIEFGKRKAENVLFYSILILYIVFQLPIMFVSHSSWAWGTKAFSRNIIVNNFDTIETNNNAMIYNGFSQIENCLKLLKRTDRVISSGDASANQFRFSCSVESFQELCSPTLTNPEIVSDYISFGEYLDYIQVKALVVFKEDASAFSEYVNKYLEGKEVVQMVEDVNAIYYQLR